MSLVGAVDEAGHGGSCRIFYAEQRCTCRLPSPEAVAAGAVDEAGLREALRYHHPIMRSETGPFSGCRCGQVRLGQDVIAHVLGELHAALAPLLREMADTRAKVQAVEELIDPANEMASGNGYNADRMFTEQQIRAALSAPAATHTTSEEKR